VTAWLLTTLGGAVVAAVVIAAKADLEDADVYRWVARRLVYRAALRLPRGERARWREEAEAHLLDLPGRLLPLWWALDTYWHSGSWGRARGAPSRLQALIGQVRAAGQRLRSLPAGLLRARPRRYFPSRTPDWAPLQPLSTTRAVPLDSGLVDLLAAERALLLPGFHVARVEPAFTLDEDLSAATFARQLRQQRRDFEADLDRRTEQYRRRLAEELGL
jgi:hypothetical protein